MAGDPGQKSSWRYAVPVTRMLPTPEAADLLELVRDLADRELAPRSAAVEDAGEFPRDLMKLIGASGLLGLPFSDEYGGGDQPYEVYLQMLEEVAARWATVGLSMSVHTLSCWPLAHYGSPEQTKRWLPDMIGGQQLGAFCMSEPDAGSDAAAVVTRAKPDGDEYVLNGTKAWITHGGEADFYTVFARTSEDRSTGLSCFLVPADSSGLSFGARERKMGLTASPTTTVILENVRVSADHRIGAEGEGLKIALEALSNGRLGIAAVSTGIAQAALDAAVTYAKERTQFGKPIIEHQGLRFLIADMAAAVASGRALYIDAARRRDQGFGYTEAASTAKLVASDNAMEVTTNAVQVFGGSGYTRDYPVERYFREAKVMQIFEGTNQVQRMVISRTL